MATTNSSRKRASMPGIPAAITAAIAAPPAPKRKPKPRPTVRERLGAVMEATVVESALDRVLAKRLRPLRDEVKEARIAFEEQTLLRAEAEIRAARAEDEAKALRVRLAQLEGELAAARQQPTSWWRRRRVAAEQLPV